MTCPRFTKADYRNMVTALAMVGADAWDDQSYGPRPNWEKLMAKVMARLEAMHERSKKAPRDPDRSRGAQRH